MKFIITLIILLSFNTYAFISIDKLAHKDLSKEAQKYITYLLTSNCSGELVNGNKLELTNIIVQEDVVDQGIIDKTISVTIDITSSNSDATSVNLVFEEADMWAPKEFAEMELISFVTNNSLCR